MKKLIVLFAVVGMMISPVLQIQAQEFKTDDVLGKWNTIDDETERKKSVVEIYKEGDKLYGKIIELFRLPDEDPDPVCDECDEDDPRYNQKVNGMVILEGLEWDDDQWDDGKILDPKNGKIYSCKLWIEDGDLQVRGYLGFSFIGRSQTWIRVE
ncbi:MAG: hypothetical protein CL661_07730 [Bacteroidetes bacterium]|jgi:uncharacterized protein (DUF2147 family)|nr:hypothetical protein [Bacteroidota bacterium]|tara:strand:+ start:523 stop:984 length:462 start_codon:yes stop_codon:yes gene_type:complete